MSDIKKLLESFSNIETTVTEGKPIGHDYKFKDYLDATAPVRKQKPGVLATKKQTSKLVGDGGESVNASGTPIEEDMVAQIAREFADFLNNKKPVLDNVFPSAEDRDLSGKPEDRTLTTEYVEVTESNLDTNLISLGFAPSTRTRATRQKLTVSNLKSFGRKNFTRLVDAAESLTKQGYQITDNEGAKISYKNASGEIVQLVRPYGKTDMQVYKWDSNMAPHELPKMTDVEFQGGQLLLPED